MRVTQKVYILNIQYQYFGIICAIATTHKECYIRILSVNIVALIFTLIVCSTTHAYFFGLYLEHLNVASKQLSRCVFGIKFSNFLC